MNQDVNKDVKRAKELGPADAQEPRSSDNSIGIDDIGLESGLPVDDAVRLDEIKPDPEKLSPRP